ncbi:uncharacterized protein LOC124289200 [Haliotis rubra]|uniref:uncharacterized protein LOC124289200 n=1 Tax=Haliotis rubra TaxID=36100 RepID=UPI001EE53EC4|nr:uncharacterized protein LOC124289200 [Haliotis rubra]
MSGAKRAYFHIRNIGLIRRYLDQHSTIALVQAHVTSRLDYCNSLLFWLPNHLIKKLQQVQNTAARVVRRKRKFDNIQPVLQDLHWLPVRYRIQYKILVLVFLSLHNKAPDYLSSLLTRYHPPRTLRSCDKFLLTVPSSRLATALLNVQDPFSGTVSHLT